MSQEPAGRKTSVNHQPTAELNQGRHIPKPSVPAAIGAVVALLIFALWLDFFLAQEIESLGREIEAQRAALSRIERGNEALVGKITLIESQANRQTQAEGMDFAPQQPLYLAINRPLVRHADPHHEVAFWSLWSLQPAVHPAPLSSEDQGPNAAQGQVEQNVARLP